MFNLFSVKNLFDLFSVKDLSNLFSEKNLQNLLNLLLTKDFVSVSDSNIQMQITDYKNRSVSDIFENSNLLKLRIVSSNIKLSINKNLFIVSIFFTARQNWHLQISNNYNIFQKSQLLTFRQYYNNFQSENNSNNNISIILADAFSISTVYKLFFRAQSLSQISSFETVDLQSEKSAFLSLFYLILRFWFEKTDNTKLDYTRLIEIFCLRKTFTERENNSIDILLFKLDSLKKQICCYIFLLQLMQKILPVVITKQLSLAERQKNKIRQQYIKQTI